MLDDAGSDRLLGNAAEVSAYLLAILSDHGPTALAIAETEGAIEGLADMLEEGEGFGVVRLPRAID
jgi:hypothetical protein